MPVLPLVGSMMTVSLRINPSRSAASIIARPMRSLTLHSGFMFSIFPTTVATQPSVSRRKRTSGVLPMHWVMSSKMRSEAAMTFLLRIGPDVATAAAQVLRLYAVGSHAGLKMLRLYAGSACRQ